MSLPAPLQNSLSVDGINSTISGLEILQVTICACAAFLLNLKAESEAPLHERRTAAQIEALLEKARMDIHYVQQNCPTCEGIIMLRVHWLSAWIDLLEHDANKLVAKSMTYAEFLEKNAAVRLPTINQHMLRTSLGHYFKAMYLRALAVLDKVIEVEVVQIANSDDRACYHAKANLRIALLEGLL